MTKAIHERDKDVGLITVSNHISCMDDPLMWGPLMTWSDLLRSRRIRWILAADDICFTKKAHALLFTLGKVLPVCRGDGVYQQPVDFMLNQLNKGGIVHMFPEGKINLDKIELRLKWGVGRMIADCKKIPMVVPFWIVGIDDVLPNRRPYIPLINKKVTFLIGEPMEFSKDLKMLKELAKTPREIRKHLTDKIQVEFSKLREKAEQLHYGQNETYS